MVPYRRQRRARRRGAHRGRSHARALPLGHHSVPQPLAPLRGRRRRPAEAARPAARQGRRCAAARQRAHRPRAGERSARCRRGPRLALHRACHRRALHAFRGPGRRELPCLHERAVLVQPRPSAAGRCRRPARPGDRPARRRLPGQRRQSAGGPGRPRGAAAPARRGDERATRDLRRRGPARRHVRCAGRPVWRGRAAHGRDHGAPDPFAAARDALAHLALGQRHRQHRARRQRHHGRHRLERPGARAGRLLAPRRGARPRPHQRLDAVPQAVAVAHLFTARTLRAGRREGAPPRRAHRCPNTATAAC